MKLLKYRSSVRGAVSSCCLASSATIAAAVLVSLTGPLHYCAAPPFISCGDTTLHAHYGPNYFRHCYLVIMMAPSRTPQPTTRSTRTPTSAIGFSCTQVFNCWLFHWYLLYQILSFRFPCIMFCSFNFIYFFSKLGTSCVDTSKQNLLVEKTFTVKIQNKEQNPKSLRLKTLLTFAKDSSLHFMKYFLHVT